MGVPVERRRDSVPTVVPTDLGTGLIAGEIRARRPVMMTKDAVFALGF